MQRRRLPGKPAGGSRRGRRGRARTPQAKAPLPSWPRGRCWIEGCFAFAAVWTWRFDRIRRLLAPRVRGSRPCRAFPAYAKHAPANRYFFFGFGFFGLAFFFTRAAWFFFWRSVTLRGFARVAGAFAASPSFFVGLLARAA